MSFDLYPILYNIFYCDIAYVTGKTAAMFIIKHIIGMANVSKNIHKLISNRTKQLLRGMIIILV